MWNEEHSLKPRFHTMVHVGRAEVRLETLVALRAWAWDILIRGADVGHAPEASLREWDLFLSLERCAAWIHATCTRGLRDDVAGLVRERALAETSRAMAARAELSAFAREAGRRGWRAVVLKGAAESADGPVIDVMDIDLLPERSHFEDVVAWYREQGYALKRGRGWVQASPAEGVPVDIHCALKEWPYDISTSEPIGSGALRRMNARDQLWHLLLHTTEKHADRSGCLRDVLLMRRAWERTNADERREVVARAESYPDRLRVTLGAVMSSGPDENRLIAARRYAAWRLVGRLPSGRVTYSLFVTLLHRLATDRRQESAADFRRGGAVRRTLRVIRDGVVGLMAARCRADAERALRSVAESA